MKKRICALLAVLLIFLTSCGSQSYDFGPVTTSNYKKGVFPFKGKEFHCYTIDNNVWEFDIDDLAGTAKLYSYFPLYTNLYADNAEDPSVLCFEDTLIGGYYVTDDFQWPDWRTAKFYQYENINTHNSYYTPPIDAKAEIFSVEKEFLFEEMFDVENAVDMDTVKEIGFEFRGKLLLYTHEAPFCVAFLRAIYAQNDTWYFFTYMPETTCFTLKAPFAYIIDWYVQNQVFK